MRTTIGTIALSGLLALGAAAPAALAQDNAAQPAGQQGQWGHGPRKMDPDAQLRHMTKQLELTADQQAQIKPLLVARDQQAQQLFADQSLAQADRHAKMKVIQDETKGKILAVLNDAQKQQFESMHARMEHHGPPPDGQAAPQK
jgi:Spy/CpxP family protein refolding chaperone